MEAVRAPFAFDGSRFLDGGATVLVGDGSIVGILPYAAEVPSGTVTHDHPGATVLPGLIDSHTHLVGDSRLRALERLPTYSDDELDEVVSAALARQLAAGVTTVRDLGDRAYLAVQRRDRGPTADLPEPRILASGPPITTTGGHCWFMGGEVDGRAALVAAVRERVDRGVDIVKVMASGGMVTVESDPLGAQFDVDDLRAAVETAHAGGVPLTAHAHSLLAIEHAVDAGVDGIEHCTGITTGGLDLGLALMDRIAAAGIVVCPTVGMDREVLAQVPPPPPSVAAVLDRLGMTMPEMFAARYPVIGGLHRAGVRLLAGVDSGIGAMKPHGFVPTAVATLLDCGLSTAEALAAATSSSADALGLGGVTGRLAPGLAADLLVVTGEVEGDIGALGRTERVVRAGRTVSSPTLGS